MARHERFAVTEKRNGALQVGPDGFAEERHR